MLKNNEKTLLDKLKECAVLAKDGCIGLSVSTMAYEKADDLGEYEYVDYNKMGFNISELLRSMFNLADLGLIELIDTENMNYFIYVK